LIVKLIEITRGAIACPAQRTLGLWPHLLMAPCSLMPAKTGIRRNGS
jgi:hypothetical protein